VADLCAAPGGKTAQLAFAGAEVTAVDRSPARLNRLRDNMTRLGLKADAVVVDALEWKVEPFDAILLDAPCSSTGTIRRHPDVPWLKSEADLSALTVLQHRLLDRAIDMLKPGGMLVYCVCSLEPEEGEQQVAALLDRDSRVARNPVTAHDVFDRKEFVTGGGDLRTLPLHLPDSDPLWGGLDGFYAARLTRKLA
jgi:16S rRNA (cytosine967-C5)-methyltransferase